MLVEGDECVIQSHLRRIRVTNTFTPEFVFAFLNTEFALAQISRRIYIQSTIATIGNRLLEIAIPHLGEDIENTVTSLVREAMDHYSDRKKLMQKAREQFDNLLI